MRPPEPPLLPILRSRLIGDLLALVGGPSGRSDLPVNTTIRRSNVWDAADDSFARQVKLSAALAALSAGSR